MILLLLLLKSAECGVGCTYEGYQAGYYKKPNCICYDMLDYEAVKAPKRKVKKLNNVKSEIESSDYDPYDDSPYLNLKK